MGFYKTECYTARALAQTSDINRYYSECWIIINEQKMILNKLIVLAHSSEIVCYIYVGFAVINLVIKPTKAFCYTETMKIDLFQNDIDNGASVQRYSLLCMH